MIYIYIFFWGKVSDNSGGLWTCWGKPRASAPPPPASTLSARITGMYPVYVVPGIKPRALCMLSPLPTEPHPQLHSAHFLFRPHYQEMICNRHTNLPQRLECLGFAYCGALEAIIPCGYRRKLAPSFRSPLLHSPTKSDPSSHTGMGMGMGMGKIWNKTRRCKEETLEWPTLS
jgi:hypothetical protein